MTVQAICMWLLLATMMEVRGQTSAGLKLTVTKEILDKVNDLEIRRLQTMLSTMKLDDAYDEGGDFSWRVSDIHISSAGTLSSSVQLGTGSFTWSLEISSLSMNARWKMKYDPGGWLVPTVRDSGSLSSSVGQSGVTVTVQPVVQTGSLRVNLQGCSASLSGLDVSFGGGLLSRFYELVIDAFKGNIRRQLEKAICNSITDSMKDVHQTLTDVQTTSSVHAFNTVFTVDNGLTAVQVTSDHISTLHKGTIMWAGQLFPVHVIPFNQASPSSGVSFDLAEEFFNNVLAIAVKNHFSDAFADSNKVKREQMEFMYLTCEDAFCLGRLLPQAKVRWPDRVVGVRVYASGSNLALDNTGATLNIQGRMNFSAESATAVDPIFSARFDFALPVQIKFYDGSISAKLANASGQIVIDQSNIGKVLIPGLKNLFDVMTPNLTRLAVENLNSYPVSYELKLPKEVMFQTSSVQLFPKIIRINADLCQKGTSGCSYSAKDEWVGRSDGGAISVVDTITTTTTSTTTTTTTTTKRPPTTTTTTTTTPTPSTPQKQTEPPTSKYVTKTTVTTTKRSTEKTESIKALTSSPTIPQKSTEKSVAKTTTTTKNTKKTPSPSKATPVTESPPRKTTSVSIQDLNTDTVLKYNASNNSTRRLIVDLSIGQKSANSPLTATKATTKTSGADALSVTLLLVPLCICILKSRHYL